MKNLFSVNSLNEVLCGFIIMASHISQNLLQLRKPSLLNSSLNLFHPLQKQDFHDKLNYNDFPSREMIQQILNPITCKLTLVLI